MFLWGLKLKRVKSVEGKGDRTEWHGVVAHRVTVAIVTI